MFAVSAYQSVAWVIAVLALVGWVLWLLANVRRAKPEIGAELELAPNRKPYFDDEELEGRRMEAWQLAGLAFLTICAVGLPLYWLAEPGRMEGAITNFDEVYAHPGEGLYATTEEGGFNCAGCHGGVSGGVAPYTMTDPVTGNVRQVLWKAPSLDDVYLRMSESQLREVLVYGRPFSPMPAWGLEGGGPMNEQQIDNLIAYLKSVAITEQEAEERSAAAEEAELVRLRDPEAALAQAEEDLANFDESNGSATDKLRLESTVKELEAYVELGMEASPGSALFNVYCARCHTRGWSYYEPEAPGSGAFGPPLSNVLYQFPNPEDHYAFVAEERLFGEKYGVQGKASARMPYFGQVLTEEQIDAIVEYERSLAEAAEDGGES